MVPDPKLFLLIYTTFQNLEEISLGHSGSQEELCLQVTQRLHGMTTDYTACIYEHASIIHDSS